MDDDKDESDDEVEVNVEQSENDVINKTIVKGEKDDTAPLESKMETTTEPMETTTEPMETTTESMETTTDFMGTTTDVMETTTELLNTTAEPAVPSTIELEDIPDPTLETEQNTAEQKTKNDIQDQGQDPKVIAETPEDHS
ncbi:hypothetical protein OBRU01_18681 [Operophtera brumata]|uniref:Uncharacterized protein n=1 Tax=Operophtera brumata TaxID=104452 RepID=A0A0L7KYA8_OPEBR|nr:hypothetical protein OBRU01_18681 [Operophtera brumata]